MKFYFDGELISVSKSIIYTHAIVYPAKPETGKKWQRYSRYISKEAAERALAKTRRGMSLYDPEKAHTLRVVELEARP